MGYAADQGSDMQGRFVRGRYRKAAVDCWFTSSGQGIPRLVKYEDDEGCLQTLRNIQVLQREQQHYGGLWTRRYACRTAVEGRTVDFLLLYHAESNSWELVC